MAYIHLGTATTLAAETIASLSNGDTAKIWLDGRFRWMVFDSTSTHATDTTSTQCFVRPHDYSTAGVWEESVGALQDIGLNAGQIATGILSSVNLSTTTGCQFDLDNELLKIGGTNVNFALSVTPGVIMGLDSGAYKFSIGKAYGDADTQSFIKWSGSAMSIRLASGETFGLYGGLTVYNGGDISILQGGDLILDGGVPGDPSVLWITGAEVTDTPGELRFFTSATRYATMFLEEDLDGRTAAYLHILPTSALDSYYSSGIRCKIGSDSLPWTVIELNSSTISCAGDFLMSGNNWVGLGSSAGRIEFDNQTIDEINFLDCRVGYGTSTPTAIIDINSNILRLRTSKTPSSASDTGNTGDICWDSSYIYVCTATDTWKRTSISTW